MSGKSGMRMCVLNLSLAGLHSGTNSSIPVLNDVMFSGKSCGLVALKKHGAFDLRK